MRLDAHQHFWIYTKDEYPWMTEPLTALRKDYLPPDLEIELRDRDLEGSIVVQARQTLEESRWLCSLSDQFPIIRGVVGWVDLQSPKVEEQLAEFANHPKFVGVRHVLQDELDDEFMLRDEFVRGLSLLKRFGLTYDLLVFPRQLPAAVKLVQRLPEQPFVLDHLAKPDVAHRTLEPWRSQIRELAHHPNVHCKVSGLVTEAHWHNWQRLDFRPYLDVAFESFGPERLLFGSDWPVCLLSGSYREVHSLAIDYFSQFPPSVQSRIFGENAAAFYGCP